MTTDEDPFPILVSRVRALLDEEPGDDGDDAPGVSGFLRRLCRAGVRGIPASGVGVSVFTDDGGQGVAAVSDPVCAVIEELQFALGEGPCLEAHASRRPVLQPDLSAAGSRWPAYVNDALSHGVRAVFAFPLQIGAARVGVMDVYRHEPGTLSRDGLALALSFAEVALGSILDGQARAPTGDVDLELSASMTHRAEVYQAQGMVRVQLGVPLDAALARMRAHAFSEGRTLTEVAADIVARRLVLERDST